ncbi:hypothetical protein SAMN05216238_10530 [Lentibacillus persicus]|uniref:Quinate/shikimate 5-dehydrogenase/glutamyl-tRNA reductase domain-containing protein n=1 Tax=Lentibacillus persicus TaxID=640948 RepID=A0A1I1W030_9BACI|nr:hypothetical protein [Lentibacillus persicus]SFD86683.1 hypothetical protein SAMN05216238_10530 [Lentibacillus persicus]
MGVTEQLNEELKFLNGCRYSAITINSTARYGNDFLTLPRRRMADAAVSGFLIDDYDLLLETLQFFDGKVDTIFVDIEQKKKLNLYETAKAHVYKSELVTLKPNDMAVEACDTLVRHEFQDNLAGKNIIILGTGNLAGKITLKLSERQANIYILGRSKDKETAIIEGLNTFTPAFAPEIRSVDALNGQYIKADAVISFISGTFEEEAKIRPYIDAETFFVDGGINNFNGDFIKQLTGQGNTVTRLDVRIGLPYQFIATDAYTTDFFQNVYGKSVIDNVCIVSGGFIGEEGSVIVDNKNEPGQIVGIADGMGGVKRRENLTESDREAIQTIQESFSVGL